MGGTEDDGVDVVLGELLLHVLEVHAPDAILVDLEGRVHDVEAVVLEAHRETDVGRAVEKDLIARLHEGGQRGDDTTEDAVLIADALLGEALDAVARLVPLDDGVEVLIGRGEVTKRRVLSALDNRLGDGRHRGEVHVGNPHGDAVKALGRSIRSEAVAKTVDGDRVHAVTLHVTGEVILHEKTLSIECLHKIASALLSSEGR